MSLSNFQYDQGIMPDLGNNELEFKEDLKLEDKEDGKKYTGQVLVSAQD